MELNEINSANMTDRIVESISRTNDGSVHEENSALNEHIQREDREESEEIYEEYKFEGDYEEYGIRCQECNQEASRQKKERGTKEENGVRQRKQRVEKIPR